MAGCDCTSCCGNKNTAQSRKIRRIEKRINDRLDHLNEWAVNAWESGEQYHRKGIDRETWAFINDEYEKIRAIQGFDVPKDGDGEMIYFADMGPIVLYKEK